MAITSGFQPDDLGSIPSSRSKRKEKMYKDLITEIPNWPKEGVTFKDISPLLKSDRFHQAVRDLGKKFNNLDEVDFFVGIDSRGFIFASALATMFNKGVVLARKKGKLPPPFVSVHYELEYGKDYLQMGPGKGNVIIIDDVLATGGTLSASKQLCEAAGYSVIDCGVLIDLKFLHDDDIKVKSLIVYE